MSNKVVLGSRPESLPRDITVTLVDGSTGVIPVNYIYRTRTEYGKFIDSLSAVATDTSGTAADADDKGSELPVAQSVEPSLTWEAAHRMGVERQAHVVMQVVKSWGLDYPYTKDGVEQLMDEQPNAYRAILDGYREALIEGRLGN